MVFLNFSTFKASIKEPDLRFNGSLYCSMFCCTLYDAHSSFAIILMGKTELVALLSLFSWCLVIVVWLFLAVPWVCLQFVSVVFPEHTHLLFLGMLMSHKKGRWAYMG